MTENSKSRNSYSCRNSKNALTKRLELKTKVLERVYNQSREPIIYSVVIPQKKGQSPHEVTHDRGDCSRKHGANHLPMEILKFAMK